MHNRKLAAVVLAGGFSSRMGQTKALLPFGPATNGKQALVIDRVLAALAPALNGGPLVVVTGHDSEALARHLQGGPALLHHNPAYAAGMFGSVVAGVQALAGLGDIAGFYLLPADYPLVMRATVQKLAHCFLINDVPVAYPVYFGKKGHPPLISSALMPAILAHNGTQGLKGVLASYEAAALRVEVQDPGVLTDMDTPADYKRLQAEIT